nr:hypothetical protein [Tanacetum cinerariifolium]
SAGKVNLPTGTKTSLAIPSGVQIARFASSRVIRVGRRLAFLTDTGYAEEESPLYAKQSVFESKA